ncbi:MAG: transcription elongation factor GreA [Anaerolineae bacterium]|nr:transcription elongation factor GreA [Anaerolineae bacterium]
MLADAVYLTEEGKRNLEAQLDELINVRRPALAERLHFAIKQGDLSENADYTAAKEEQGFLEGRILEIKYKLRNAVLIDPNGPGDGRIGLGSEITLVEDGYDDRETYYLVGPTEADPGKGKISHVSPLGKALMGHRKDDTISVAAPAGKIRFKIIKVK